MRIESLDLDGAEIIIRKWAESNPYITKVYLFGSRINNPDNVKPDSDLDVAIEFTPMPNDENCLTTWICESKRWHQE